MNTMNQPKHAQFTWAMQRLAQMQGGSVDVLRLNASSTALDPPGPPLQALRLVCQRMGLENPPKLLKQPDRAHLPLLCHTEDMGWGIVVDRNPLGQWIVATPQGPKPVSDDTLKNRVALLRLAPAVDLGFGLGLFKKEQEGLSFFSHVRETLKTYRVEIIEACVASAFIGVLALATSLFSMQVYDRVIPTRSEYTLVILSLGVLLSILIELAMKYARSHIMDYVVVGMDHRLSREIFHRLLQLRVDQIPASVGSLAGQMRGYEQVRGFYTASTLFTLIDLPLALLFLVVIMFVSSPWVAVVPLIFGVIALFLGLSIRQKIMAQAKEGAALSNLKTGLLVEAVEGIETIKAGSGGWKFLSRWIGVNSQTIRSDLKMRHTTDSVGYLSATIQQISYAGLVVAGAIVVMQGQMTMGALIASSILSGRILAPVMAFPGLLVQHAHAQAALEGLERLYTLKTDHHGTDQPLTPSLIHGHYALQDIKFAYGDNPPAMVLPKLDIRPAERIAILGPIGAGKSTLLRLLSGLYHPQEGRVLLDNLDLAHINRQVISQYVGYLQQDHRLFQGSLRENLLIGLPDPGDDVLIEAMKRTGMDRFVASHPKGLERPIAEGGKGLSGGQKQLVAFTRLVLCDPTVMLLALAQAHTLITPTEWQKAQLPPAFREQTQVIFDGVDTSTVAPDPNAWFSLARAACTLRPGDEVITFVNRNFEPGRGFHVFMRTLPRLLARRPKARVVLIGGDDRGYGPLPADGGTWRQALLKELDGQLPMDRIHFVGRLSRQDYLHVLQVSACHVYLTYPFVLSWSLVEAMAMGCAIVASNTPPVAEFMTHARHGQLVDFFDQDALAQAIEQALDAPAHVRQWREAARAHIVEHYDLHRHCLPAQLKLLA